MRRRAATGLVAALLVGTCLLPGCSKAQACAGIGLNGPLSASPQAARDAYLSGALHQEPGTDYSAWRQVSKSKDGYEVGFRAPPEEPGLTVPGGQDSGLPGLLYVTRSSENEWRASGGCA